MIDHYCIVLTDGTTLHVDSTVGPLSDFDLDIDDPADGADRLWEAIQNHHPIYVTSIAGPHSFWGPRMRIWYPNSDRVVAVIELEPGKATS
jgi:hypothetical protein